jgi:hypothetical protein
MVIHSGMEHVDEACATQVSGDDLDATLARTIRELIAEVSKPAEACPPPPAAGAVK